MTQLAVYNGATCWGTFTSWHSLLAVLPPEALRMRWSIVVGDRDGTVVFVYLNEEARMEVWAIWALFEGNEGYTDDVLLEPLYRRKADAEAAMHALQMKVVKEHYWEPGSRGYRLEELQVKL